MKNAFSVSCKEDFILVVSKGAKNLEFARQVLTDVVKVCDQNCNYRILGISNTSKPVSVFDGYEYHELFKEAGVTHKYKIAWVEGNKEFVELYKFIELVLSNRGLPGKVFTSIKEAKSWLLDN
jgi:hypothetical protein